ncbi:MarR family winged helix-turn-helix transcriptional regulator [Gordonia aurantiaca]|uniref:MarR family winged helix-turn-helix transcriptional regulator n=1 Tax=Gordonia sp. B21 TaxID=3151852 RepID=UPI003263F528
MSEGREVSDFVDKVRGEWATRYPDLDLRPVDAIGRIVRIGSLALSRLEHDLAPLGITRTEFDVLGALARSDIPLRASEVTSVTGISGASTTKNVERLVSMGLVERRRLERDGRVVLLSLTEKGRTLVDEQFPRRIAAERQMLDGLDDDEIATLTDLLRRVARNVERRF